MNLTPVSTLDSVKPLQVDIISNTYNPRYRVSFSNSIGFDKRRVVDDAKLSDGCSFYDIMHQAKSIEDSRLNTCRLGKILVGACDNNPFYWDQNRRAYLRNPKVQFPRENVAYSPVAPSDCQRSNRRDTIRRTRIDLSSTRGISIRGDILSNSEASALPRDLNSTTNRVESSYRRRGVLSGLLNLGDRAEENGITNDGRIVITKISATVADDVKTSGCRITSIGTDRKPQEMVHVDNEKNPPKKARSKRVSKTIQKFNWLSHQMPTYTFDQAAREEIIVSLKGMACWSDSSEDEFDLTGANVKIDSLHLKESTANISKFKSENKNDHDTHVENKIGEIYIDSTFVESLYQPTIASTMRSYFDSFNKDTPGDTFGSPYRNTHVISNAVHIQAVDTFKQAVRKERDFFRRKNIDRAVDLLIGLKKTKTNEEQLLISKNISEQVDEERKAVRHFAINKVHAIIHKTRAKVVRHILFQKALEAATTARKMSAALKIQRFWKVFILQRRFKSTMQVLHNHRQALAEVAEKEHQQYRVKSTIRKLSEDRAIRKWREDETKKNYSDRTFSKRNKELNKLDSNSGREQITQYICGKQEKKQTFKNRSGIQLVVDRDNEDKIGLEEEEPAVEPTLDHDIYKNEYIAHVTDFMARSYNIQPILFEGSHRSIVDKLEDDDAWLRRAVVDKKAVLADLQSEPTSHVYKVLEDMMKIDPLKFHRIKLSKDIRSVEERLGSSVLFSHGNYDSNNSDKPKLNLKKCH